MTAKALLHEAYEARMEINTLMRRRDQYMAMATGTSGMSETAIRSSEVKSKVESSAIRLVEICDRLDRKVAEYAQIIAQAEQLISRIERSKYRQVLSLRYLEGKSWKAICEIMGYRDEKSAYRIHGWALAEAEKIKKETA